MLTAQSCQRGGETAPIVKIKEGEGGWLVTQKTGHRRAAAATAGMLHGRLVSRKPQLFRLLQKLYPDLLSSLIYRKNWIADQAGAVYNCFIKHRGSATLQRRHASHRHPPQAKNKRRRDTGIRHPSGGRM